MVWKMFKTRMEVLEISEHAEKPWREHRGEDAVEGEAEAGECAVAVADGNRPRCAYGVGGRPERQPLCYRAVDVGDVHHAEPCHPAYYAYGYYHGSGERRYSAKCLLFIIPTFRIICARRHPTSLAQKNWCACSPSCKEHKPTSSVGRT